MLFKFKAAIFNIVLEIISHLRKTNIIIPLQPLIMPFHKFSKSSHVYFTAASFCKSWKTAAVVPILFVFLLTPHRKLLWPAGAESFCQQLIGCDAARRVQTAVSANFNPPPHPSKNTQNTHIFIPSFQWKLRKLSELVSAAIPQNPSSPVSQLIRYLIWREWKHLFNPSACVVCLNACLVVVVYADRSRFAGRAHYALCPPTPHSPLPHVVLSQGYVICQHKRRRCWMDRDLIMVHGNLSLI